MATIDAQPQSSQPETATAPKSRSILVTGATGKQGRSFISAVLSTGAASDIHVLALTRSTKSPAARALADAERVTLVEADLDKPETVKKVFEDAKAGGDGIWSVFLVLAFPGLGADATGEENQGKLVADLSKEYGVQHLIYSSAERGDEDYDKDAKLDRLSKARIEGHIKSLEGIRWIILRPVFFMENFDGVLGRITATALRIALKQDTKLQLVSADDIGHVALAIFISSDPSAYAGQGITVLGDALTTGELAEAYQRGAGKPLPSVPGFVGRLIFALNKHTKELMAEIERSQTYRSQFPASDPKSNEGLIQLCQTLYPAMKSMEAWARARGSRKDRAERWNNVSIWGLLRGKL